jgi:hypothetical protein
MERTGQAVTGAHGNCPEIMPGQTICTEELVGGKEACRGRALHESYREVAANAVTS